MPLKYQNKLIPGVFEQKKFLIIEKFVCSIFKNHEFVLILKIYFFYLIAKQNKMFIFIC